MKKILYILIALTSITSIAQDLSVERIWKNYEFNPKRIGGYQAMNDGEHYLKVKDGSFYQYAMNDLTDKGVLFLDGAKLVVDRKSVV